MVLDLTRLLPGAAATQVLANFGAEVIKVEEPGRGDYGRSMPPSIDGEGAVFRQVNRGKKSVVLDLKQTKSREAFLRLAERADVLIEGFRPGVMARLGLNYELLSRRNPALIYVALSGYGQSGPYSQLAGHDINYLALAGVLDQIGAGELPVIPGIQLSDLAGGAMQAVIGVLMALAARQRTGRGQFVDIAMRDGVMSLLAVPLALREATGETPVCGSTALSGRYACYNVYQARDGRWLAVGALEPKFWSELCRAIGCEDLIGDQFAEGSRQETVKNRVAEIFRRRDAAEWFTILGCKDACVTPVQDLAEARPAVMMPALSETPGCPGGAPPRLGQHTREVLLAAGLTESEVAEVTA
jgi:crotonobetainyl-CoA:carnitine CoA-transferase CaiB-like acyl-CoA transferase